MFVLCNSTKQSQPVEMTSFLSSTRVFLWQRLTVECWRNKDESYIPVQLDCQKH